MDTKPTSNPWDALLNYTHTLSLVFPVLIMKKC